MQPDGLDMAHLEEVLDSLKKSGELGRVKLLYLGTYFQNPTGITTSLAKKSAAFALLRRYERAAGHPIYLVEDAAYRELRFSGDDVPSTLTAPGSADRVIYTGTYSKPFATGVRVGFGLLPEPILRTVLRIKGNHDFGTSNLLQHLLARALKTGLYDEHVKELRARYARKGGVMVRSMREHLPSSFQYQVPNGGLYFWGRLPGRTATGPRSRFFKAALQRGVLYVPGELCYAPDKVRSRPRNELRLSFGAESERKLREGIRRLGLATHEVVGP